MLNTAFSWPNSENVYARIAYTREDYYPFLVMGNSAYYADEFENLGAFSTSLGLSKASGSYSFAGGVYSGAGDNSLAYGYNANAMGNAASALGRGTTAHSNSQTAIGEYNVEDRGNKYAVIVGNGDSANARSNALTVDWDGNVEAAGIVSGSNMTYGCPFPVGGVYISVTDSTPSQTWPGTTWTQIAQGRFLVGQSSDYAAGATGDPTHKHTTQGHKLTAAESGVPAHSHGHNITVKTPKLTHSITQPTIASSGKVAGGITGGSHAHNMRGNAANAGWSGTSPGRYFTFDAISTFGSTYCEHTTARNKTRDASGAVECIVSSTHTHDLPNHSHTLGTNVGVADHAAASCTVSGGVSDNTAAAAANAHSHGDTGAATAVPPWFGVYMWERTA